MIPLLLPLLLTPLLHTTLSQAWVFTYRNGTNDATSFNDPRHNKSCTEIDNPEGSRFEWEPQSGPWCLYLYKDSNCTRGAGHTCRGIDWVHETSQDLNSFEVQTRPDGYDDPAKESESGTASAEEKTVTVTSVPTDIAGSGDGGREPLSGGGIAGVVIGVLAGVVLFSVLGFFLGKKAGRKQGEKDASVAAAGIQNGHGGGPGQEYKPVTTTTETTSPMSQTQFGSPTSPVAGEQTYRPPGSRMVELVGNNGTTELSDTNRVMELDGSSSAKSPLSPYRGG